MKFVLGCIAFAATAFAGEGATIQGEFLWWKGQVDNIEYGLRSGGPANLNAFPLHLDLNLEEVDFEYDPGVRLSLGYDFGEENWDVFLRWTYEYTSPSSGAQEVIPLRGETVPPGMIAVAPSAFAKWQLRFNSLDFEMGYELFPGPLFSIRPHMGLKGLWIDMDYHAKYDDAFIFQEGSTENLFSDGKSTFWGVGPRFGAEGRLYAGYGVRIVGQLSLSALYGAFDAKGDSADVKIETGDYYRLRPSMQMGMGIEWKTCFSSGQALALQAGWETNYFWNQLQLPLFGYSEVDGDLTLNGGTWGVRFDF